LGASASEDAAEIGLQRVDAGGFDIDRDPAKVDRAASPMP